MTDFETAIDRVLGHEGGYSNDSNDPGGETNWGISKRSYPTVNIATLTRDTAKEFYYRDFWVPVVALIKDRALQYQMLDAAINHGMGNAVRMLQRAVDANDDGHWGNESKVALALLDPADVQILFIAERLEFFTRLKTFPNFGRGWARRIALNLRYAAKDN